MDATPQRPLGFSAAITAGLDVGTLPAAAAQLALALTGFTRRVRFDVQGAYVTQRRIDSPSADGVGLRAQAWSVGARGCWRWHTTRAVLAACASVRGGLVHARGRGASLDPESARQPWVGLGPAGIVTLPVSRRVGLLAGIDVHAAVARGGFRTEPSGRVAQSWPVVPTAWIGLHWRTLTGPRDGGQPRR